MNVHQWKNGISRRKFLSYLGFPAALTMVNSTGVWALTNEQNPDSIDYLAFADREGLGPRVDAPTVEKFFYPLHREQPLTAEIYLPDEVDQIKSVLKAEFERAGYQWNENYKLRYSYQHFGVPDESRYGPHLLRYCEQVFDFLYSRLDGLFDVNMSWQLLPTSINSENSGNGSFLGNIGRYTYYIIRVYVDHPELDDLPSLINAQPLERAIHYIVGDESHLPKQATLYVISGPTSLVAPFSELLHLTFHEPSQSYARKLTKTYDENEAQRMAVDAGETINEASAIVLAKEFIDKYGAGERVSTIDFMANSLNTRFKKLNGAINFIERNGVQKSLDTYMESPGTFMKLVTG